jgi:hypothetical protein
MTKKDDLKNRISAIWKILTMIKECHEFSYYLHRPNTQDEADYINKSNQLQFLRHLAWRNEVIELAKLFSSSKKRDKFNIFDFLNNLKDGQYFGDINFDQELISKWELSLQNKIEIIELIMKLRDKVYSHTDNSEQKLETPSFEEILKLINITEEIVFEIHSKVFNSHTIFENSIFHRERFQMIEMLIEAHNQRIENLLPNKFKKSC